MPLLTLILIAPAAAGLANLLPVPRRAMRWLNVMAFAATLAFGIALLGQVLARGVVSEWNEFLYADALSAWMVLLISMVSPIEGANFVDLTGLYSPWLRDLARDVD